MHFMLIVSTPEGEIYRGNAVNLSLRGVEGDLAVMAGHTPFITAVKPCACIIEKEEGAILNGEIDGGLLTVSKESVTLLTGHFITK
ncbi:MAG: F0F1 ATP synthase subunit epsilon [Clostridia bacterium]|nr:F0F1 ATP synthase subunit epsilon [Clostridia bacterium]